MDDLIQKVAIRGSKGNIKVLRKNQDLKMPIVKMSSRYRQHFKNASPTEMASQMKDIDNGFVELREKYGAAASAWLDPFLCVNCIVKCRTCPNGS